MKKSDCRLATTPDAAGGSDEPTVPAQEISARPIAAPRSVVVRIPSGDLFPGGATELLIDHRGTLYRLKRTALGKLILTK